MKIGAASHLDWYKNASRCGRIDQVFRASGQAGVTLVKADQAAGLYRRPGASEYTLQLQLSSGAPGRVDHGERFSTTTRTNHLVLSPINVDLEYQVDGHSSFLTAVIPQAVVEANLADGCSLIDDFGPLHVTNFADDTISSIMLRLWELNEHGSLTGRLFADSAWTTIITSLAILCESGHSLPKVRCAVDWRVRRLVDFLVSNLSKDLGLAEIAAVVGLSPRHTLEVFRAGTGLPPHRWITQRRVEHACGLLMNPINTITKIAHDCGFSSSQHFATVFKRYKNVTPGEYRRDRVS